MLIVLLAATVIPAADYHWPLDLPKQLSSSFGEFRTGRLHAGIDLRTAGTGRTVYAAESGHVTRVRCSPYGYGKAVYIQLIDGNTAIYAHLEGFEGAIDEYVRRAQHQRQKYEVDLYPEAGALPVERGQAIARSGQTGVGVPHLHYEIRDPAGRPINPRSLGIDWPDVTPPTMRSVLVAPLTAESRVNGDVLPVILPVRETSAGEYVCNDVTAFGPIGIGVALTDPANGGASKLGIRSLITAFGEVETFRMTRDRLSYDTLNNGLVAYHPYLLDRDRFLVQWRWPGNRSESFAYPGGDGRITAGSEAATIAITAADFHDNAARVRFNVSPPNRAQLDPPTNAAAANGAFDLDCYGEFLVISAVFNGSESESPVLALRGGSGEFIRIDHRTFRAAIAPTRNAVELVVRASHPRAESFATTVQVARRGASARSVSVGDRIRLQFASNSPYGTLFVWNGSNRNLPRSGELELVTNPETILPTNAPMDTAATLSIALPQGETRGRQLHIYRARRNGWSRVSTSHSPDLLSANTRALGTFAVLADETAPKIGPAKISGARLRPVIQIPVRDAGSGIDRYDVRCGDDWLLTAYDPERDVLEWERDRDLPENASAIRVQITDHAGNTGTAEFDLR